MSLIEVLESRIAPAGIIDVIVSGGNLVIKTSAAADGAEEIVITPGATDGAFKIDPDAATQIRFNGVLGVAGAELEVAGVTKGISISLGKDNDQVTITGIELPGAVKVDLGEGSNDFTLEASLVSSVSYKGGTGDDNVALEDNRIAGKVDAVLGNGTNSLLFENVQVVGDFTVKGGLGADVVGNLAGTATFGGKFTVQLGDGANQLLVLGGLFVGKDAVITSGKNNDDLDINSTGALTVGGNLTFNTGKGSDKAVISAAHGIHVGKNVSFISAGRVNPADTIGQEITAVAGLMVGGNVTFTGGDSETTTQTITAQTVNASILGKVSFKAQGNDVDQTIFATRLQVGGSVTMDAKEKGVAGGISQSIALPTVDANVQLSQIKGAVTMNGADSVSLVVTGDIFGSVKINTGKSVSASMIIGPGIADFAGRIHGGLTVKIDKTATDSDVNIAGLIIGGATTFTGSNGADKVSLHDLVITGATKIETGDGGDTVEFDTQSTLPFVSQYFGAVSVNTGGGADTINVSAATNDQKAVFMAKSVFKTGGTGETLTISNNASFLIPAVLLN